MYRESNRELYIKDIMGIYIWNFIKEENTLFR